jgi:hypothetical protein
MTSSPGVPMIAVLDRHGSSIALADIGVIRPPSRTMAAVIASFLASPNDIAKLYQAVFTLEMGDF